MRLITFILAVIACVAAGYSLLQLQQMRQQIAHMQTQIAHLQNPAEPAKVTAARRHLQRAQQLINQGRFEEASKELEQGAKVIAESSQNENRTTLQQIQQMLHEARQELARFWTGQQETKP